MKSFYVQIVPMVITAKDTGGMTEGLAEKNDMKCLHMCVSIHSPSWCVKMPVCARALYKDCWLASRC